MILSIGTDIVKIDRIKKLYTKFTSKFTEKILSKIEQQTFNSLNQEAKKIKYLASRFAAKEACSKAIGTGIGEVRFKDIIILNDSYGKPYIELNLDRYNSSNIELSISDEQDYAVAFVIIWSS